MHTCVCVCVFMVTFITRVVKQPGSSDGVMEVELHTCSKVGLS